MPDPLLPDTEALAVAWARAQDDLTALVGTRVATAIPPTPTFPLIRLNRVSGTPDQPWRDLPRIQAHCYADLGGEATASLVARTLVACLGDLRGSGEMAGAEVVFGPFPDHDPETQRPRVQVDFTFAAHN